MVEINNKITYSIALNFVYNFSGKRQTMLKADEVFAYHNRIVQVLSKSSADIIIEKAGELDNFYFEREYTDEEQFVVINPSIDLNSMNRYLYENYREVVEAGLDKKALECIGYMRMDEGVSRKTKTTESEKEEHHVIGSAIAPTKKLTPYNR